MVGQFLLGAAPRSPDSASSEPATLDFANASAEGGLDLEAAVPGAARAEVWLHNRGAADLGQLRLRCSDLLAHDGSVIGSAGVTLSPTIVPIPGRSSRGIDVKIDVPQGIMPGVYRGMLLVENHPGLWLPVVLTVRSSVA